MIKPVAVLLRRAGASTFPERLDGTEAVALVGSAVVAVEKPGEGRLFGRAGLRIGRQSWYDTARLIRDT